MNILGISAFYHDSAAAIICDGHVVAAAQEERFTRIKHDPSFPEHAVRWCLEYTKLSGNLIDYIAFYDKPFLKFERLLETAVAFAPKGFMHFLTTMPVWVDEKLFQKSSLLKALKAIDPELGHDRKMLFSEHHYSHAASAFYPSPFNEAAVLTMDGVGEWATSSLGVGRGHELKITKEIHFPHSLGLLYSAFTYYCGFKVNSGEYKLMGLAPYGQPEYVSLIKNTLVDIKEDGSFRLNLKYFDYCVGWTMTNKHLDALFGMPARKPEEELLQKHMDIAASIQAVTEEIVLKIANALHKDTGLDNLCLAGGVALNCVANGRLLREGAFKNIWIQPAAGDAGGAVGAALAAYHQHEEKPRVTHVGRDGMSGSYLGPDFSQNDIEAKLTHAGAVFTRHTQADMISLAAQAIADEKVVGWFQGRMEFGPRALGSRSILADPRSPQMQKKLNLKIKYRESFRPFAPSVLREEVSEWFAMSTDSPYMLLVADVHPERHLKMTEEEQTLFGIDKLNVPRSDIPAVTHVDYSARVQTVYQDTHPTYHALISKFKEITSCPVVVNTSFNIRGEPIVCTPEDAFRCFMGTEMDMLVVGNCILLKEEQAPSLRKEYQDQFVMD